MTTRQDIHRLGVAAATVVLVLGAGGCGSSGGSSNTKGDTGSGAKSGTTATNADVSIKREPLCPKFDLASVASTFHSRDKFKVFQNLRPGQKYSPFPGQSTISRAWICNVGTANRSPKTNVDLSVSISGGMPYTSARYDAEVKRYEEGERSGKASCEASDSALLGARGRLVSCARKQVNITGHFASGYATAVYFGLADKAKLTCSAFSSDSQELDTVKAAGEQLCSEFIKSVTK